MAINPIRLTLALNRMFATLPLPSANADPKEALKVYFEVCEPFPLEDVELAVRQFVNATVPGHNPAFAPTAAQFVAQIRANREQAARSSDYDRRLRQQFHEQKLDEQWQRARTPEAKAKVKAILDGLKKKQEERTPEEIEEAKAALKAQDKLFSDEFVEALEGVTVSKSLMRYFEEKPV